MLIGRDAEQRAIGELMAGARAGRSGVLVLTGEAGIGKTVLLEHADTAAVARGMRVQRVVGNELERDLGYGGLSQLVGTATDDLARLPAPQAQALAVALNLREGPPPDRFAVAAATLGLLTHRAEDQPLAVLVDDAHLLDHLSAAALAFAARRLLEDPVVLVAAVRSGEDSALLHAGLPVRQLSGLDLAAATELLAAAGPATELDQVDRLVRATGGNPLALLELQSHPVRWDTAGPDAPVRVTSAVIEAFRARTDRLSAACRTTLLLAAAGGTDRRLVARASRDLGVDPMHLVEATDAGLVRMEGVRLEFRHPLVRAAVYGAAPAPARRAAHAALARATPEEDLDRRAWHLAAAAPDTDAAAAQALHAVADRARARSAYDVAASALERAGWLSPEESQRSARLLASAEAAWVAGQGERARAILEGVGALTSGDLIARSGRLRATIATRTGSLATALEVIARTTEQLGPQEPDAATELWADGVNAAFFRADTEFLHRAVGALETLAPLVGTARARVLGQMAAGMARTLTGQGGADQLRAAVAELATGHTLRADPLRAIWLALGPLYLREEGAFRDLVQEALAEVREGTVLGAMPLLLMLVSMDDASTRRWARADSGYHEGIRIARESGQHTDLALLLAALAGLEARIGRKEPCREHAAEALELCARHDIVVGGVWATLALAELELGAGRPGPARDLLLEASAALSTCGLQDVDLHPGADLTEALLRLGEPEAAREQALAYQALSTAKGQPWALARAHRVMGMVADDDDDADQHFAVAAQLHEQTPDAFEEARTELAHGASLRRRRRRKEARVHLRAALEAFEELGAQQRAEQAAVELAATGESVQPRGASLLGRLTPQERQIAQLLADGQTTREAAAGLFLSPKTIEYHLRHVYTKLGINSRAELAAELAEQIPARR
ncbi:MAG: AAA family ATPase [Ornithinimicrobium sp.]|uniref:helix-turn-helix transcriptional regulator n=1 Tax=Ornithinimicrobium sp. TaxID=1977084 RepID=UPI003D9B4146